MKKFLVIFITLLITFSISAYAVSAPTLPEPVQKVYSPDGRIALLPQSRAEEYIAAGWFDAPVVTIYKPNGETSLVFLSDAHVHLANGWYMSPDDFPKKTKAVALTYDDGPSKYTNQVLDCLERYGAKATFFVVGTNVNRNPEILKRAHSLGMEIGNHTANHQRLTNLSASGIASEINSNATYIENATGIRPTFTRPPYGSYTSATLSAAKQPFILWSIDTLDWKTRNADSTVSEVLSKAKDGDIILMHDLYSATVAATERIVPALIDMGFDLVTVSELAQRKGVTMGIAGYRSFK